MTARVTFVAHTLKCELIALSPAARVENVEIDQISCMSMLYAIARSERGGAGVRHSQNARQFRNGFEHCAVADCDTITFLMQ